MNRVSLHSLVRTPERAILTVWIIAMAAAFPILVYLSFHPEVMLRLEESQPSAGIYQGREWLKQGNIPEAIRSFERAYRFFTQLFEESGLESHQVHRVDALAQLADVYKIHGATPEWQTALEDYDQAIRFFPNGNHGLWMLSQGDVLQKQGRFEEAIPHYDAALEHGYGVTRLLALYGRGRAYLMQGRWEPACADLSLYVRYPYHALNPEQWVEFLRLEPFQGIERDFVLAHAWFSLGQPAKVEELVRRCLAVAPDDREAEFLLSKITDGPVPNDVGEIPIRRCFPIVQNPPYPVVESLVYLYVSAGGPNTLHLSLSAEISGTDLPELHVLCNGKETGKFLVSSSEIKTYSVEVDFWAGKNQIILRTRLPGVNKSPQGVELHTLELKKAEEMQ